MLSAIVIVGPEFREEAASPIALSKGMSQFSSAETQLPQGTALACVEVLGRSVVGRLIEEVRRAGVDAISVFAAAGVTPQHAGVHPSTNIPVRSTEDAWGAAAQELVAYKEAGVVATLLLRADAYAECDFSDMLQFHREQGQAATRALDKEGPLDIWIVDPARLAGSGDLLTLLRSDPARYSVRGYVNRLQDPKDLRRLVADALSSRCRLRPQGSETRPGVWMDEGAQVHRDARIVAPAYIGRGARIAPQCLITRCSNIESNCEVDYGTVVEDSSILLNSYVGIGLDLSHSIVDGNNLINLERNVTLEIADPCVIRQNRIPRKEKTRYSPVMFGIGGVQFAPSGESSR